MQTAGQQRVNKALERTCGTSQRQHELLLPLFLRLHLPSLLCLLFHSVRNNISRYIHGYSGNPSRMVCKLSVRRSRGKNVWQSWRISRKKMFLHMPFSRNQVIQTPQAFSQKLQSNIVSFFTYQFTFFFFGGGGYLATQCKKHIF